MAATSRTQAMVDRRLMQDSISLWVLLPTTPEMYIWWMEIVFGRWPRTARSPLSQEAAPMDLPAMGDPLGTLRYMVPRALPWMPRATSILRIGATTAFAK